MKRSDLNKQMEFPILLIKILAVVAAFEILIILEAIEKGITGICDNCLIVPLIQMIFN